MSHSNSVRAASARGAILIHVAVGLLFLLAFSAFAVDYGVVWVARGQAQNAADTAAMAAAVAWAYDVPEDLTPPYKDTQAAGRESAAIVATHNPVWFEPAAMDPETDVQFFVGDC